MKRLTKQTKEKNMGISRKISKAMEASSWIRKMFEEGAQLKKEKGAENVYDFTLGNPITEPPKAFEDKLKALAADTTPGTHAYMPNSGLVGVREKIAAYLKAQTGLPYAFNHITMTVGAAGGLNVTLKALLDPGDEVLALSPFFVEYGVYADNHGGILKPVPTTEAFLPDLEKLAAAITPATKALIINSPNNPTGVVYPKEVLKALGDLLATASQKVGHAIYLISDEPYRKIAFDNTEVPYPSLFYKDTLLITSHSKDLSLPGERIGYIAIHPESTDAQALATATNFTNRILGYVNAPALMQRVVADLQEEPADVAGYQEKRDLFYPALTAFGYEIIKPKGAFYLFPKAPGGDDVAFVNHLKKYDILAVPGTGFGTPGYFRLAYCVRNAIIEKSLDGFKKAIKDLV